MYFCTVVDRTECCSQAEPKRTLRQMNLKQKFSQGRMVKINNAKVWRTKWHTWLSPDNHKHAFLILENKKPIVETICDGDREF